MKTVIQCQECSRKCTTKLVLAIGQIRFHNCNHCGVTRHVAVEAGGIAKKRERKFQPK